MKKPLKELNKLHFSHILEKVTRQEGELNLLQKASHNDQDNASLLDTDK